MSSRTSSEMATVASASRRVASCVARNQARFWALKFSARCRYCRSWMTVTNRGRRRVRGNGGVK